MLASQSYAPIFAIRIFASFLSRAVPIGLWWAQMDSDHRPHAYQACALTSWAMSPCMVEVIGFEPMTPCLQGRCSTSWAIPPSLKKMPPQKVACSLLKTNKKETISISDRLGNGWVRQHFDSSLLPKRRWSSRTFRYGYLVTTSPQSLVLP